MPYRIFMVNHFRDANGDEHDLYYWDAAKRVETAHQTRLLLLGHRRVGHAFTQELGVEADRG